MDVAESGDERLNFLNCERDGGSSDSGHNSQNCAVDSDSDMNERRFDGWDDGGSDI